MNKKPRIAIPLGDPAGVGPEIVVKSIASQEVFDAAECVVIGDKKIIDKAIEITGVDITVHVIAEPEDGDLPGQRRYGTVCLWQSQRHVRSGSLCLH